MLLGDFWGFYEIRKALLQLLESFSGFVLVVGLAVGVDSPAQRARRHRRIIVEDCDSHECACGTVVISASKRDLGIAGALQR